MLIPNWRKVAKKAWSVQLMYAASILTGCEAVLPLFSETMQRGRFALLSFVVVTLAGWLITDQRLDTFKAEAGNPSVFVSGWRPFIGWVCGAALCFQYLVRPFWVWGAAVWLPDSPVPPTLDGMLWELIMGMLGIGGLRTVEKWKGVAR